MESLEMLTTFFLLCQSFLHSPDEQQWRSERCCAANCVYLLLRLNDKACDYSTVEKRLVQGRLSNANELQMVARENGLETAVIRTDLKRLSSAVFPVIAHVEQVAAVSEQSGHFILITKIENGIVQYYDGTTVEEYKIPTDEFEKQWTGVALVARPPHQWMQIWTYGTVILLFGCIGYFLARLLPSRQVLRPASAILFWLALGSVAQSQTIEQISSSYLHRYGSIRSVAMDATVTLESPLGSEVYFNDYGYLPGLVERYKAVYAADGRFYTQSVSPWMEIGDEVSQQLKVKNEFNYDNALEQTKKSWDKRQARSNGLTYCFDGSKLRRKGESLIVGDKGNADKLFEIMAIEKFDELINPNPIDWQMYSFCLKANPTAGRRQACLFGEYFDLSKAEVLGTEKLGAHQCVRVKLGNSEVWFCTDLGYMVMRRDIAYEGAVVFRVEMQDPEEVTSGMWLARKVIATELGATGFDMNERVGKPLCFKTFTIKRWRLNDREQEALLKMNVVAGNQVIDHTVTLDKDSTEAISYVQPANQSEIDAVIAKAKKASPADPSFDAPEMRKPNSIRRIAMMLTVGCVALVIGLWVRGKLK